MVLHRPSDLFRFKGDPAAAEEEAQAHEWRWRIVRFVTCQSLHNKLVCVIRPNIR